MTDDNDDIDDYNNVSAAAAAYDDDDAKSCVSFNITKICVHFKYADSGLFVDVVPKSGFFFKFFLSKCKAIEIYIMSACVFLVSVVTVHKIPLYDLCESLFFSFLCCFFFLLLKKMSFEVFKFICDVMTAATTTTIAIATTYERTGNTNNNNKKIQFYISSILCNCVLCLYAYTQDPHTHG